MNSSTTVEPCLHSDPLFDTEYSNTNAQLKVEQLTLELKTSDGIFMPVKDVNFTLTSGKTLALLGESGSGKTLTALSILQLLPLTAKFSKESKISFLGKDLLSLPEVKLRKLRGKEIAMIFQEPMTSLNPVMPIHKQIEEVFSIHHLFSKHEYKAETLRLLEAVQIQDVKRIAAAYPHELSGGLRQRVMIAIALAGNPKILIADEPTTALDVVTASQILSLLKQIQKEFSMSLLFITHDLKVASKIADDMVIMKAGKSVEKGSTQAILRDPKHDYTKHLFSVQPKRSLTPFDKNAEEVLSVHNLSVHFPIKGGILGRTTQVIPAVDNVSLTIKTGETLGLVGESGSGKTTLAKAIMALIKPTRGEVLILGHDITRLSEAKLRKKRNEFQIIFQDPFSSMDPRMRAKDLLHEGMLALGIGSNAKEREERSDVLMQQVGLNPAWKNRYPHQFSGGERQRLCIARALSVSPRLIVCDEPTSSLDASVSAEIIDLFLELQQEYELSYLFISHNISVIKAMAHQIMVMYKGSIVESGDAKEVLNHPTHEYTKKLLACS